MIAAVLPGGSGRTALAKCQPYYNGKPRTDDNNNYQAGREALPSGLTGVYSDILNYSPWVQPNDPGKPAHAGSGWVMLDNDTSPYHYSQVGWWEFPGSTRQTFNQYTYNGTFTNTWSPQPTGYFTYYELTWYTSLGEHVVDVYVGGSQVAEQQVDFTPIRADAQGEINTLASQMPGGYNYAEAFDDSHVQVNGATWDAFNGVGDNSNSTYFGDDVVNSTVSNVWDKACAS
jgi:hypothetical protein